MIIYLTGKKGSGKDYVGNVLKECYDYKTVSFADIIKDTVMKAHNISLAEYDTLKRTEFTNNGVTIHGRDVVRNLAMTMLGYDTLQFVRYVDDFIKNNKHSNIVVTDLRFEHELDYVLSNKDNQQSIIINVINTNLIDNDSHISEQGIGENYINYTIYNDGKSGIMSIKEQLEEILTKEGKK